MTNRIPLTLGTIVKAPDGTLWEIGAVMLTGGERYYMLVAKSILGFTAMWPAAMVESLHDRATPPTPEN